MLFRSQVLDPGRRETAKVLALQSHLEGKAKAFLIALRPTSKTTYALAAAALCQRFLVRPEARGDEWASKAQAVAEMHSLEQGALSSEEYIDKSNDLFAVLGEEYSMVLATKFMDGIRDPMTRVMVDSQVDKPYALPAVLRVFSKSTKSICRQELINQ